MTNEVLLNFCRRYFTDNIYPHLLYENKVGEGFVVLILFYVIIDKKYLFETLINIMKMK